MYFMQDIGAARQPYTAMSNHRMVAISEAFFCLSFGLTMGCSAYIAYFSMTVEDNLVTRNVLMSFVTVLLVELFVSEPVRKLLHAGVLPAVAASIVANDIIAANDLGAMD